MKTKLSNQSLSPIPVTFQMDSPSFPVELEVKSKTRTNRVCTKLITPTLRYVFCIALALSLHNKQLKRM